MATVLERNRELEQERQQLVEALAHERERSMALERRANALEQSSRSAWRVAAQGRRPETP